MKRFLMIAVFLSVLACSAAQAEAQQYYSRYGVFYGSSYNRGYTPAVGFNYPVYRSVYYGPQIYPYSRAYYYPPLIYAYPGYPGYAMPPYGAYGGFRTPGYSFYYGR